MRARTPGWERRLWLGCGLLAGLSLAACGDDDARPDAGQPDTGPADTGPRDAGPRDQGPEEDTGPDRDTGPVDMGPVDMGPGDTGPADTGPVDMGPIDMGPPDTGPIDMGPDLGCYSGPTDPVTVDPTINLYAIHDSASRRYRDDCLACHANQLALTTLDPAIEQIHPRMIPAIAPDGCVTNETCTTCHVTVEFGTNGSAGNLRRQVDVSSCATCHGAGAFDYYLP